MDFYQSLSPPELLDDLLGLWVYTLLFDKIYYTHDSDFLCVTVFCLSALLTAFMRFSGLVYAHNGVRRGFVKNWRIISFRHSLSSMLRPVYTMLHMLLNGCTRAVLRSSGSCLNLS